MRSEELSASDSVSLVFAVFVVAGDLILSALTVDVAFVRIPKSQKPDESA